MNPKHIFEPHLVVKTINVPPAGEWKPELPGWIFAHVTAGQAYVMHALRNQQLETGGVVAFPSPSKGYIRASQLDWASLHFFQVEPERLAGLVTLGEQQFLRSAARHDHAAPRVFVADHALSQKFRKLCVNPKDGSMSFRLRLLEIFTEALGDELKTCSGEKEQASVTTSDARTRVAELIKQMPIAAMLELTLDDFVKRVQCTPRHVSRVFSEMVGMSFRQKQSEIRLQRAQELLATTESKVLEVAMESGFQSVSLFNLMFKRRFGLTPGKWRERVKNGSLATRQRNHSFIWKA
jgi:AraC-like DNA-binding protein